MYYRIQILKSKDTTMPLTLNVVHTVDGAWILDGQAMTNEQLVQAISGEAIAAG
jgi:hypothetical protein